MQQDSIHASDSEKTSSRFILDSLRGLHPEPTQPSPPPAESQAQPIDEPKPKEKESPKTPTPSNSTTAKASPLPWTPPLLAADKKYFRASEVGQLLSVEAHVLRYWQKEFPVVRPQKHGGTHWVYSRRDVETLHLIQHLLYREGLSIREAKREIRGRIRTLKEQVQRVQATPSDCTSRASIPTQSNPDALKGLMREIKELIQVARNTPSF